MHRSQESAHGHLSLGPPFNPLQKPSCGVVTWHTQDNAATEVDKLGSDPSSSPVGITAACLPHSSTEGPARGALRRERSSLAPSSQHGAQRPQQPESSEPARQTPAGGSADTCVGSGVCEKPLGGRGDDRGEKGARRGLGTRRGGRHWR